MKYKIEKNTVQETLVITLYARKVCSELYPRLYQDETAVRLIGEIDYDFSEAEKKSRSLMQRFGALEVAMRQNDLAFEIRDYLKTHPNAAVVNLGCGLDNTGRYRDNGSCLIYNLDFPDVIAVRNELLPAGAREQNIPCDLNDTAWFSQMLRLAAAAIDRTEETEDMPRMDENGKALSPEKHDIVFDHVNFSYEQKPILRDISVTLPDKTTTAVIGPSGSGKTTFCNPIARFWDTDSGSVKIGGYDVKDYTLESLMEQISVVFQNVYLFADTIENNIKFGKPEATHDEVVAAAKAACCDDFIESLPDGYQTVIGEGGASLSGGEKQRISIARAMLKNAPIVILDEATANVDPKNEGRLQRAIEALTRDKTIIMIAHRLKTVRHADQILVIDHGHIVQQGKHEQLIAQPGIYADFVGGKEQTVRWKL